MKTEALLLLLMMVAVSQCLVRSHGRSRTTPAPVAHTGFNEENVVKFNRQRWREDEEKKESRDESDDDDDDSDESFFRVGNNGNSDSWLRDVFGESVESTDKDDASTDDEKSIFPMSHFPSIFSNNFFLDSNLMSFPSADSLGPNMCQKKHSEERRDRNAFNGFIATSCSFINGNFQCSQSSNKDGITRRVINTWSCCEGFSKDPSMKGCPIVEKETNLECLKYNNMTELITALNTFELSAYLNGEDANEYTILAPNDLALKEYKKHLDQFAGNVLEITPEMEEAALHIKDRLLTHILPTPVSITDFGTVKRMPTVLNQSGVFFYRHSLSRVQLSDLDVSVNCKPLEPVYMNSKRGRVYTLKGFLSPLDKTFKKILENHQNATEFLKLISSLNESEVSEAGMTIFVPTDKAFEGLAEWTLERIKNNPRVVLDSLSAKYPLCPHQFESVTAIKSLSGDFINISKQDDAIKFNRGVLEGQETVSSEGTIIYFVDSFPSSLPLLPPVELVEEIGASKFADLLEKNNFQESIGSQGHLSLVVPSNKALEELKETDDEAKMLKYHTIVSGLDESGLLETADGEKIFYKRYLLRGQMKKLMQCVPVKEFKTALGITLFSSEKILARTEGTLLEILEKEEKFSMFLELVQLAEMDKVLASSEHRLTLLAVDNQVFSEMEASSLERLKRSKRMARRVIMDHIINSDFCSNDPSDQFVMPVPTHGHRFVNWVASRGEVKVAGIALKRAESDRMASNGILHVIDGLMVHSFSPTVHFTFFEV